MSERLGLNRSAALGMVRTSSRFATEMVIFAVIPGRNFIAVLATSMTAL